MSQDCVFCDRIFNGEYQSTTIPIVVRFEPLNPVVAGHMLFVPMRHSADATAGSVDAGAAVVAASDWAWERKVSANIITSIGEAATQTILHTHIHYVPRFVGDGLALPWTGQSVGGSHDG